MLDTDFDNKQDVSLTLQKTNEIKRQKNYKNCGLENTDNLLHRQMEVTQKTSHSY